MLQLDKLESLTKKRKTIGRGGSRGGTSGQGHKGQKARSGGTSAIKASFEGGQMPLVRRIPRRGFTNVFKKEFAIFNLHDLEINFLSGENVDRDTLKAKGLLRGKSAKILIKILGKGELTKNLIVKADAFSKSAIESIEKASGKAQLTREINSGSVAS